MSIAFDSSSMQAWMGTGTSFTWAHTCNGSNVVLILGGGTAAPNYTAPFTGATYNGVAMNSMTAQTQAGASDYGIVIMVALLIGTGDGTAHNIVANYSSTAAVNLVACSYTGVKQTGFPDVTPVKNAGQSSGSSITVNITTSTDKDWVVMSHRNIENSVTGLTSRAESVFGIYDSNGDITPAGTLGVVFGVNTRVGPIILMAMAPALASGPANLKSWNGLAKASIKSINGLAIASVKTWNGLA